MVRAAAGFEVDVLDGFYRLHAAIYDWTRPLLLFGRREAVGALKLRRGERVLDVDCGTGYSPVRLGPERLEALRSRFPRHEVVEHSVGLWRYFVFRGGP